MHRPDRVETVASCTLGYDGIGNAVLSGRMTSFHQNTVRTGRRAQCSVINRDQMSARNRQIVSGRTLLDNKILDILWQGGLPYYLLQRIQRDD